MEVFDAEAGDEPLGADVEEVVNYVRAMELGLRRLETLPLSTRLIREMHGVILAGVRGRERQPGELRTTQNWIGPPGATIETATFVPPPPGELGGLLTDLERFVHDDPQLPPLVQAALVHYQFETIHPFLDGNGRIGRLLIVFFLVVRDRLALSAAVLVALLRGPSSGVLRRPPGGSSAGRARQLAPVVLGRRPDPGERRAGSSGAAERPPRAVQGVGAGDDPGGRTDSSIWSSNSQSSIHGRWNGAWA